MNGPRFRTQPNVSDVAGVDVLDIAYFDAHTHDGEDRIVLHLKDGDEVIAAEGSPRTVERYRQTLIGLGVRDGS